MRSAAPCKRPLAVYPALCFLSLFILLQGQARAQASYAELHRLYKNKQYFELRDRLAEMGDVRSPELEFFRGAPELERVYVEQSSLAGENPELREEAKQELVRLQQVLMNLHH